MARNPNFENIEDLKSKIDEYFKTCEPVLSKDPEGNVITDKKGNPIYVFKAPTVSGLALYLGFLSRQSIYDYINMENDFDEDDDANKLLPDYEKKLIRKEKSYIVKRALLRIEEYAESGLIGNKINPIGAIFWLKNHKWVDRQVVENEYSGDSPLEKLAKSITKNE